MVVKIVGRGMWRGREEVRDKKTFFSPIQQL